jgi:hypothetical protein
MILVTANLGDAIILDRQLDAACADADPARCLDLANLWHRVILS